MSVWLHPPQEQAEEVSNADNLPPGNLNNEWCNQTNMFYPPLQQQINGMTYYHYPQPIDARNYAWQQMNMLNALSFQQPIYVVNPCCSRQQSYDPSLEWQQQAQNTFSPLPTNESNPSSLQHSPDATQHCKNEMDRQKLTQQQPDTRQQIPEELNERMSRMSVDSVVYSRQQRESFRNYIKAQQATLNDSPTNLHQLSPEDQQLTDNSNEAGLQSMKSKNLDSQQPSELALQTNRQHLELNNGYANYQQGGPINSYTSSQQSKPENGNASSWPSKPENGNASSWPSKPENGNASSWPSKSENDHASSWPSKPENGYASSWPSKPEQKYTRSRTSKPQHGYVSSHLTEPEYGYARSHQSKPENNYLKSFQSKPKYDYGNLQQSQPEYEYRSLPFSKRFNHLRERKQPNAINPRMHQQEESVMRCTPRQISDFDIHFDYAYQQRSSYNEIELSRFQTLSSPEDWPLTDFTPKTGTEIKIHECHDVGVQTEKPTCGDAEQQTDRQCCDVEQQRKKFEHQDAIPETNEHENHTKEQQTRDHVYHKNSSKILRWRNIKCHDAPEQNNTLESRRSKQVSRDNYPHKILKNNEHHVHEQRKDAPH